MASPSVAEASPTSAAVLPTVIPTKLRAPRIRSELVERPELVARLREGRRRALTLVCAPAGYGKSTLLAQWVDSDRERTPFVWLALDPSDSDPTRLWAHLVTGLREVHAPVGEASLDALVGGPGAIADTLVPLLVRELADAPELVVVLDDWHLVRSPLCDATMAAFVEHAPDSVQVVVSSRADPGLPVARLRAHGELAELREAALRISAHEALDLFRRADVELTNDEVERLNDRAEGWLAGICLALLVAKERPDPARFVEEFSGDTRHVLDFLADDVLAATPPEIRSFLLQTSMLDRLSADLCDAVLEISSSASLLDEIASANLFLVAVDEVGHEYRYHHLFGAMLERELRAADPAAPHRLHARASAWFEAHGDVDSAIEHAIASGDLGRTSALVTLHAHPYLANGRLATVARWLDALSWPDAAADPQLAVVRANVNGMSGRPREEVERWLELAESSPDIGPLPNGIDSLRSAVGILRSAFLTRGIAAAIDEARSTLARQEATNAWRGQTLTMLGQALYLAGRPAEARAPLEEARAIPGAAARAPSSGPGTCVPGADCGRPRGSAGCGAHRARRARPARRATSRHRHSRRQRAPRPRLRPRGRDGPPWRGDASPPSGRAHRARDPELLACPRARPPRSRPPSPRRRHVAGRGVARGGPCGARPPSRRGDAGRSLRELRWRPSRDVLAARASSARN